MLNVRLIKKGTAFYLGQTTVSNTFSEIKKDYNKIKVAYQFLHVIRSVTQVDQENKELFDALLHYLECMDQEHSFGAQ